MTAPTVRERLAHRLAPHLAGQLEDATRAAQHARAANRASQGRLLELLRTDPDRFRQARALQLLGAVLDRFHGHGDPVTARVSQANYSAWCAVYDELCRPLPEPLVADREPDQPAIVHPATDSEVARG